MITTVEERLVSLGIVTEAQARSGDIDPSEAENLEALQQRVDDTVDAGDSGAELITTVEERLVSLGIVTEAQARSGDISPSEAENLEALQKTVDDTAEVVIDGADVITTVEERLVSLGIVTEAQARSGDIDSSEAENLEALQKTVDDTVDAGDSGAESITTVEERLVSLGIVTEAQARSGDISPSEAENLEELQEAFDDVADDIARSRAGVTWLDWHAARATRDDAIMAALDDVTELDWRAAVAARGDAITAALEDVTELDWHAAVAARDDAVDAALTNVTVLDWHAAVAARDDAVEAALTNVTVLDWLAAVAARDDAVEAALKRSTLLQAERDLLEDLEDEQHRLEYRLAAAREDLRVAQAGRYVLGAADDVTVSIDDPDVPDVPILVLRAESETIPESGMATFTIETTVELVEDLDVFYVVEGSATPDVDFNAPDGDITMGKGQERVTLSIPIRADDDVEADESVTVRLTVDPNGAYRLSDRDRATIQIQSADLPELTLTGGGEVTEGGTVMVTILADQAPDTDTSVNYSVSGSAQAGIDYEVVTGTALLPAGQRSVDIPIRTIHDDVFFMPGDMVVADWPARVGSVEVEDGDLVQRGTPLFNLTDPGFTIKLFASPTDRSKLAEGQEVTVNLDAGDQEVRGIITDLDDNATTTGGNETYEGVVETTESLVGVDGAVVTIDVVVQQSVDAVVVPIAAVLSDGGQDTVRVVTPEGVIERRAISTGMLDGAYVEVVSGVAPGEYVILEIERS